MTAFMALAWVLASTALADTDIAAAAAAAAASIDLNILSPFSI